MSTLLSKFRSKKISSFHPFINRAVISIPDEWINPYIGLCTDVKNDDEFHIRDFVSGAEVVSKYKTFLFTEQRFQTVIKTDRFDLCSLLYPEQFKDTEFKKKKEIYLLKPHEINNRLRSNGFWEILLEIKEANNT